MKSKKWVVKSNDKELVCDLITAFIQSQFKLTMAYDDKEFIIHFKNRDEYLEAKDGGWRNVKITTINKKVIKWGVARFTEYYK